MLMALRRREKVKGKGPAASWNPLELRGIHRIPGLGNSGTSNPGLKGVMVDLPSSSSHMRTLAMAPNPNILGAGGGPPQVTPAPSHVQGSQAPARRHAALRERAGTLDEPRGGTSPHITFYLSQGTGGWL